MNLVKSITSIVEKITHHDTESAFIQKIKESASYKTTSLKEVNTTELFAGVNLEPLGSGLHSNVFRIVNEPWVLKESKWDLSLDIYGELKLKVPRFFINLLFRLFTFKSIVPSPARILEEYREYMEFAKYLGYFSSDEVYYHENRDLIFQNQKTIRQSLLFFKPELEKHFNFKINPKIEEVLKDPELTKINFLPKEFLVYGKSISENNAGKKTQFLIQEFVKGKTLEKCDEKSFEPKLKKKLALLIYLILLLNYQHGIFPDTRPSKKYQLYNWLTKTDNIVITDSGDIIFVDTRWFWSTKENFIKRGFLIPEMIESKTKESLNNLLKSL